MRLILALLIVANIYANDILTSYRLNGIANIEKELDIELTKSEYWQGVVAKSDTKFGYFESYDNILACDKSLSTLDFYTLDENGTYYFKKQHKAFIGKVKGDKLKQGDLKTPVGVYELTQKLSKDTKLDPFYGPIAFVTSYPNLYDRYRGKDGNGIWIHGLPEQESRDEFTRGCIAVGNDNIECLNKNIHIDNTILIVDEQKVKTDLPKEIYSSILAQLYKWRYAWKYDELESYLSFYDETFKRFDGMEIAKFKEYKKRVFSKNERKSIVFKDLTVVAYPNDDGIFYISFYEQYRSDSFSFNGNKTLIAKLDEQNRLKIIAEK